MGFISKVQIAVSTFRRSGISGVIRRVCESIRMRWRMKCWYGPRGRLLNYWKSWRTDRPILVIESDDWGAEHIPRPESLSGDALAYSQGVFCKRWRRDNIYMPRSSEHRSGESYTKSRFFL